MIHFALLLYFQYCFQAIQVNQSLQDLQSLYHIKNLWYARLLLDLVLLVNQHLI